MLTGLVVDTDCYRIVAALAAAFTIALAIALANALANALINALAALLHRRSRHAVGCPSSPSFLPDRTRSTHRTHRAHCTRQSR